MGTVLIDKWTIVGGAGVGRSLCAVHQSVRYIRDEFENW